MGLRVLLLLALTTCLWAQPLEGWVRFDQLGDAELPLGYQRRPRNSPPKDPISRDIWATELAGVRAELEEQKEMVLLRLESGKKLWFPKSERAELEALLVALPQRREGGDGYWWNQLLEEYEELSVLVKLEDDSTTEMTFFLSLDQETVSQAIPLVLAEAGMPLEDIKDFSGFSQFRTGEKQERTPGFFNPPYRRFSYLINVFQESEGCRLNIRATVFSYQQRRNSYGSSWQADLSPSIRQRIRQFSAELLTKVQYSENWRHVLADYEEGFCLPGPSGF